MAKKALLVGINYVGTTHKLRGCVNDILAMNEVLIQDGFTTTLMSDDLRSNPAVIIPTRQNIIDQLNKLNSEAQAGDTVVFCYHGHGMEIKLPGDRSAKEVNCIVPTGPIDPSNLIKSTELYAMLVQIDSQANFFAFMDCCHSASMLKLKNSLDPQTRGLTTHGMLAMISGCQDRQTSADAVLKGKPQGALTGAFLVWLETHSFGLALEICFSADESRMRELQTWLINWLTQNGFEQRPNIAYETPQDSIALLSPPPSPVSYQPTVGLLPPVNPTNTVQAQSAPRPYVPQSGASMLPGQTYVPQSGASMHPGQMMPYYSQHSANNYPVYGNAGYPTYGYVNQGQSFHPAQNYGYSSHFAPPNRGLSLHQPMSSPSIPRPLPAANPGMYFAFQGNVRGAQIRGVVFAPGGYVAPSSNNNDVNNRFRY